MKETPQEWHDRLCTRDGILRELRDTFHSVGLPSSPARQRLKRQGLIESYRGPLTKHQGSSWRLTQTGQTAAKAIE